MPCRNESQKGILFDAVNLVLSRAICRWAGLPDADMARMAVDLIAMIDNTGRPGPRIWAALARRSRGYPRGDPPGPPGKAREPAVPAPARTAPRCGGALLRPGMAAVELVDILPPTLAIGRHATSAALALHQHPKWQAALQGNDTAAHERLAEEMRRHYPFFRSSAACSAKTSDAMAGPCQTAIGCRSILWHLP